MQYKIAKILNINVMFLPGIYFLAMDKEVAILIDAKWNNIVHFLPKLVGLHIV
jgi:hypothetical protein